MFYPYMSNSHIKPPLNTIISAIPISPQTDHEGKSSEMPLNRAPPLIFKGSGNILMK